MVLENKLGITDPAELARAEEKRSKTNAARLFESGALRKMKPGTLEALLEIHRVLLRIFTDLPAR